MSERSKKIKPFSVILEGDKVEITKKMIDECDPEIIEIYQHILDRQRSKEKYSKRCLNSNGTRCQKTSCAECKRIQKIDIKDPCNGLPLHLEDIVDNGIPIPASDTFLSPEEYCIKKEQYEELSATLSTFDEKKQTIMKLHIEELSDHEKSAIMNTPQTTISYQRRICQKELRKFKEKNW